MSIWDYFEDINIITLKKSKRLPSLIENLKNSYFDLTKVNVNVKPKKFFGENTGDDCSFCKLLFDIDEKCCNKICKDIGNRHYNIIKRAYDSGKNNVMIFEDDAEFINNLDKNKIKNCIDFLKNNEWDMFFWGYFSLPPIGNRLNNDIIKLKYPLLAHCYCVNRPAMKYILDNMNLNNIVDVEYRNFKLKKYGSWPCLNYQEVPNTYKKYNSYLKFNKIVNVFNIFTFYNYDILKLLVILFLIIKFYYKT